MEFLGRVNIDTWKDKVWVCQTVAGCFALGIIMQKSSPATDGKNCHVQVCSMAKSLCCDAVPNFVQGWDFPYMQCSHKRTQV
jgi:hypothetical protein